MRTNDFDMQSPFEVDPVEFAEVLAGFDEIATKNPEDYDSGHIEGEDDYADCPEMFNYPDFS